ncbi:MAG TPA: DUF2157 domain-containing protein [Acidimicrobiales bacterium]|nr:MAG: hypothetical protein B7Z69_02345 [Actinobacteria bacterium 21-73-9]HQU25447.1 DUF2157 domain-containing protein [Acidimicrobiales bacterium]
MAVRAPERSWDLEDHVDSWVREGIVDEEQARRILEREAGPVVAPRRLSIAAELMTYLGVVLVVAGAGVVTNRVWGDIGIGGRISIGLVAAALGFLGGWVLLRVGEPGATRLAGFLWLCGTAGAAMATAVLADRLDHGRGWPTVLSAGAVVAAISLGLWRNRERPLQFASAVAGVVMVVAAALNGAGWAVHPVAAGSVVWVASLALAIGGATVLRPGIVALVLGQLGATLGALLITPDQPALGLTLGLVAGAAGLGYGVGRREPLVVVVGVLAFFSMTVRLLGLYLHGPAAALVSVLLGVALVAVALWRTWGRRARGH